MISYGPTFPSCRIGYSSSSMYRRYYDRRIIYPFTSCRHIPTINVYITFLFFVTLYNSLHIDGSGLYDKVSVRLTV